MSRREVFGHQHRAGFGERGQPAHLVGQLPDISRPAIQDQELHRFFGEAEIALAVLQRVLAQVVVGERGNFDAPLPQRRDVQRDDIETIEEVFAEPALGDQAVEVGVGRGDDADVDAGRVHLADRVDFAGLEEAQEFRLHVECGFADFVEEQRAAGGGADNAREVVRGAGEGRRAGVRTAASRACPSERRCS